MGATEIEERKFTTEITEDTEKDKEERNRIGVQAFLPVINQSMSDSRSTGSRP